ncbi:MAG: BlaI/MecI/CopY family transcriptional regulator, partial [Lachnospiraceae bacterium]|nr:BlaI/MecI/CopY family transcriptional regulator [Lachnospiraceae bacterium]
MNRSTRMDNRELSAAEALIMKAIWDAKQDISVIELMKVLKEDYGKDYKRTTMATFLLRLSEKDF